MKYRIVELSNLSGSEAVFYSIIRESESNTVFEKFLLENQSNFGDEVIDIVNRLKVIANDTGAREQFFKLKEGKLGDLVCALYDNPDKKLRLYCIRFGKQTVLLGGGSDKPANVQSWQEDKKLSEEANLMIKVSKDIHQKILDREITWSEDGFELLGDLDFTDYDE